MRHARPEGCVQRVHFLYPLNFSCVSNILSNSLVEARLTISNIYINCCKATSRYAENYVVGETPNDPDSSLTCLINVCRQTADSAGTPIGFYI